MKMYEWVHDFLVWLRENVVMYKLLGTRNRVLLLKNIICH